MSVDYPEFSSLELLNQFIRDYEIKHSVQLWKRDSQTIEKMKHICPVKLKTYRSWWKVVVVWCLLVRSARLTADSYYSVLGVQRTASPHEVRQAYKKLAVKLHPDKNPDEEVQEKFLKITEAYETLKDEEKRRNYDLHGSGPRPFYSRQYDASSQTEYNNLYYNGLYAGDEFVDTLSPASFQSYITEGMHFIKLYSPFCPPCQSLSDHWRKLAELYKGIMKVGAVNCKYHNSFCYNVLRVGSYPTLLFYPNGKSGEHLEYSGEHTLPALERFVLQHMRAAAPASTAHARVAGTCLYVLGATRVPEETLLRIAYRLRGVARVMLVEDEQFRASLTRDERVTCVVQHGTRDRPLYSDDELDVTRAVLDLLPALDTLDPDQLKKIRDGLRSESGSARPWVLHLAAPGGDRLLLYKMKAAFPDLNFGVVECARWPQLCATLHAGATPGWGVVKRGGAYQAMARDDDVTQFLHDAPPATNLHSLSPSEADRVLAGEQGSWLVLVVPHRASTLSQRALPAAALRLLSLSQLQVGIVSCAAATSAAYCTRVRPALLLVHEGHTHEHDAQDLHADDVVRFVQLVVDNPVTTLSEQQLLEVIDPARARTWLVAFLPPGCGPPCDTLRHQWRILAHKLRPLKNVHVGVLDCAREHIAFCVNIRAATARVYPPASTQTYVANMQHLSTAPYLLEWALQHLPPAPRPLTGDTFPRALRGDLDTSRPLRPWLVYFHSPRCYRCYEMFADFAIAATVLQASLEAGRVNCLAERALCQREGISVYPSLRLYLPRGPRHSLPLADHDALVADLRALLPQGGRGGDARDEL